MKVKLLVVAMALYALLLTGCNLCSLAGTCLSCASGLCGLPSLLVQQTPPVDEQAPLLASMPVDEVAPVQAAAVCY
jgi:hypothetical protein